MRVFALITHDEQGLDTSLHRTREEAMQELRAYLNDNPVSYQEDLCDDATDEEIAEAADDRSQFHWEIQSRSVPQ